MTAPLLSEVRFASLLDYSPRGSAEQDKRSRTLRDQVKQDRGGVIALAAKRIQERWDELEFGDFLGTDTVLVPAPRSAPLKSNDALWPARRICEELSRLLLGIEIFPCLERTEAVPKSAFAAKGERTKAERHFETLRVNEKFLVSRYGHITVVDDFVTTGSMLLACASRLDQAYPDCKIVGFSLVRRVDDVKELLNPCTGLITWDVRTGETRRRP